MAKSNSSRNKIRCTECKKEKNLSDFYINRTKYASVGRDPICKDCIRARVLDDNGEINEIKLNKLLKVLDKPYYKDSLESAYKEFQSTHIFLSPEEVKQNGSSILGLYFKNIAMKQDRDKTYADSEKTSFIHYVTDNDYNKRIEAVEKYSDLTREQEERERIAAEEWTEQDTRNMNYVLSTVGYDPFVNMNLTEADKKYCFNIMSSYCDTEGISEDGHKLQSVIEMTLLYCEVMNLTKAINKDIASTTRNINDAKIQKLTGSKTNLLDAINKIAKDNNISSAFNKNSRQGKDSLSSKMKEMEENGFEAIKVNYFDIKTSEAFKQIAEISNQNIANQLTLDSSEYSDIIKEQREMILKYEQQVDELEEENRNLKNKIVDLENNKG